MMHFLTGAAALISSVYGLTAQATTTATTTLQVASSTSTSTSTQPAAIVVAISTTTAFTDNTNVMAYVKAQYASDPILIDIARCESAFRQYDAKTGEVLHGAQDNQDIGVMQINERYQGAKAASLGYDIDTVEGNVAYAKYLYETQGGGPWSASASCWSESYAAKQAAANASAVAVK